MSSEEAEYTEPDEEIVVEVPAPQKKEPSTKTISKDNLTVKSSN